MALAMSSNNVKSKDHTAMRLTGMFRKFRKDRDGATAVEFALIGGPFFLLIFAIIESALFFFANQFLETTVDDVTRLFRTGQFNQSTSEAEFRQELCDRLSILMSCDGVRTDVQVALDFADLEDPPAPQPNGELEGNEYQAPGPVQILQVSAQYKWPIYTNFSAPLVETPGGNFALIQVVSVTRTEPY